MHSAALISAILLAAVKADLQLDQDDISQNCTSICRPVLELSRTCDVDDDSVADDLTEDRLSLQCLCTNNSFDVQRFTGLCASCMQQNPVVDNDNDDDDLPDDNNRDINEILSRCGFQNGTYSASDADAANGVVVAATRPNNANQLTTTITGGAVAAPTGGSGVTSAGTFTTTGTITSGSSTILTTGTTTATGATGAGAATGTGATVAGAPGLEPLGGAMKAFLTVVGATVVGFWMC